MKADAELGAQHRGSSVSHPAFRLAAGLAASFATSFFLPAIDISISPWPGIRFLPLAFAAGFAAAVRLLSIERRKASIKLTTFFGAAARSLPFVTGTCACFLR